MHDPRLSLKPLLGPLRRLLHDLSGFDSTDFLATVGALQVMPENAGRGLRLSLLANLAAIAARRGGKASPTPEILDTICNSGQLAHQLLTSSEDPFENPFTEDFSFYNGSYVVFPGTFEEATFVLRHLAMAIFLAPEPFPNPRFANAAHGLIRSVLVLSQAISTSAGLDQGAEPLSIPRGKVAIPECDRLRELKTAVRFTAGELSLLLTAEGSSLADLERLIISADDARLSKFHIDVNPLLSHPIVLAGSDYVVAVPGALIRAANDALVSLANELGASGELAERFRSALWQTVIQSLHFIGNDPVSSVLPQVSSLDFGDEFLFSLDTDKILYVLLASDPLTAYDAQVQTNHWPEDWYEKVERRLIEVEHFLFANSSGLNEVLFLVLLQGVQRMYVVDLPRVQSPLESMLLIMTVADLETLALSEHSDPLLLRNFALASVAASRYSTIFAVGGTLDKFYYYRKNDYSFYNSDEVRPGVLNLLPGGGGELRREVQRMRDIHSAPWFLPGYHADVISMYGSREVPIYAPLSVLLPRQKMQEAVLVEGLPLPVWVVGPRYDDPEHARLASRYSQFASALSYWLWQFTPLLEPHLRCLVGRYSHLRFKMLIVPHNAWFEPSALDESSSQDGEPAVEVSCSGETGDMELKILPPMSYLLDTAENAGERALIWSVLAGLRGLLPVSLQMHLSDEVLSVELDRYAPLGHKKMMLSLRSNLVPELDPRGLGAYYRVSKMDQDLLRDEFGDYLISVEKLSVGLIPDDQRGGLLQKAVGFFYKELQKLVSSLSPYMLLEYLVAHHERVVYEVAEHRLTMPTRMACFGHDSQLVKRFATEMQELTDAGVSARFVIEYVGTCPPNGLRPISLSAYNRLQALAALISYYGFNADLIENGLADIKLEMLPSGRLGLAQAEYQRAQATYVPLLVTGELSRTTRAFDRHWLKPNQEDEYPERDQELDKAAQAEFGYSLSDFMDFVIEAIALAYEKNPGYSCIPRSVFIAEMADRLGWHKEHVDDITMRLTLLPRDDFLRPSAPFRSRDVYPWRFNRELSYLRKPLLLRLRVEGPELLWGPRHLHDASEYLLRLCSSGRLQPWSNEMKTFLGRINDRLGEAFNDQVADLLAGAPDFVVRRRVGSNAGIGYPESNLGDIDVLAVNIARHRIMMVECKDLSAARTAHEMAVEWNKIFNARQGKRSVIDKQEERATWLREHLPEVVTWLGLDKAVSWQVEPLIVVSFELLTPHLRQPTMRILSLEELIREISGLTE